MPRGRATLICGSAGSGKTQLAVEFIVRGARDLGEPGVLMSFEESEEELKSNVKSLGFDLDDLMERGLLSVDHVSVERGEIEESGEYDLDGLFVRLQLAIDSVGAKRVALDTIESLFSGLSNTAILRAELRRLFRWLKTKNVTTVITGERGDGTLTRQGIEEYVSDCVISLDHRVTDQLSTRRLRVVKYRGSTHGTNEYPFLITDRGLSVLPITSLSLDHVVSSERISSGVPRLDTMLGGAGYYRGSTILLTGTAGTGKTSLAATFVDAACRRGEKCLYLAFEESESQIIRNMRSIGLDLQPHVKKGLLKFHASRPTLFGLEMHLLTIHGLVNEQQPAIVVVDPVTNLVTTGVTGDVQAMAMRLVDYLKGRGITALMTTLTAGGGHLEHTDVNISSLIDTWLLLRDLESAGERNRGLYILKSRGMAHSNQIREFRLADDGIELLDVYLGPEGVLTGSARLSQEAQAQSDEAERRERARRRQFEIEAERKSLASQVVALEAKILLQDAELESIASRETALSGRRDAARAAMAESRRADAPTRARPKAAPRRS
ncbi:MAG: circadian clock protein KaiC [Gammaproteobacteria bacterium]|nr:circadian clock protein KaiC [Gammaproteobacteria bacterium]